MTRIRQALVAGMLVFGSSLAVSAQQPAPTPTPQAGHQQGQQVKGKRRASAKNMRDRSMQGITLSAQEKASIKSVRDKYASQLKALRTQDKSQAAPDRQKRMELMQAEQADIRTALSPANQTKFDANIAKMKERASKPGHRKG